VRENVTISYRGARYEIGRGQHFYGIWVAGAPQAQPLEWWPETPAGWSHAWARFTGIEVPGTIVAVSPPVPPPPPPAPALPAPSPDMESPSAQTPSAQPPGAPSPGASGVSGELDDLDTSDEDDEFDEADGSAILVGQPIPAGTPAALALDQTPASGSSTLRTAWARAGRGGGAAGLIIAGVILGVIGLFPTYLQGGSLASEPADLVPHSLYFAAWLGAAVLILLGGPLRRFGALLAAGTSVVTFGLFFADAGTAISGGAHAMGAGLVLGLIGWLLCAIGSGLAVGLRPAGQPAPGRFAPGQPAPSQPGYGQPAFGQPLGRPQRYGLMHVLTLFTALAGLGTAIAFAPSWDSYTLRAPNGASTYVTAGNAFSNPGWVITGDVFVMISVFAIIIVAASWRPVREGAWLLAGAVIPMAAQAISALVQAGEATPSSFFGIPSSYASQAGITITNGLTPAFWLYCAFVVVLMATCGWLLLSPRALALDVPPPVAPSPYFPHHPMYATAQGAVPSALPGGGAAPGYPSSGAAAPAAATPATAAPTAAAPTAAAPTAGFLPGGLQPMTEQPNRED